MLTLNIKDLGCLSMNFTVCDSLAPNNTFVCREGQILEAGYTLGIDLELRSNIVPRVLLGI
jgi:hypothetical protein